MRNRPKLYERMLNLIWPRQGQKIRELAQRFQKSQNDIVRRALDFGLPILEKLGIDNPDSGGTMDTETGDKENERGA